LHASPPTDEFTHSYTPTLGSLLEANSKKLSRIPYKVAVVGVTHTGPGKQKALNAVAEEVQKIASIVKYPHLQCLEGEKATVEAVKLQLKNCSWVHLACHGSQDLVNPTNSSLSLYGGYLNLDTILRMPLSNAQFVFLAACQTAMGDAQLANESFHLAIHCSRFPRCHWDFVVHERQRWTTGSRNCIFPFVSEGSRASSQ
jgi:CHAT domain-containing protein